MLFLLPFVDFRCINQFLYVILRQIKIDYA